MILLEWLVFLVEENPDWWGLIEKKNDTWKKASVVSVTLLLPSFALAEL